MQFADKFKVFRLKFPLRESPVGKEKNNYSCDLLYMKSKMLCMQFTVHEKQNVMHANYCT